MNTPRLIRQLDELHIINQHAFSSPAPSPGIASYSICFWFCAETFSHRQVIAHQGRIVDRQPGWQIFIQDGLLQVELIGDDLTQTDFATLLDSEARWHHIGVILNREQGRLQVYVNGEQKTLHTPLTDADLSLDSPVIIGGYTDPAGGHFDHTFGREGSGLVDDFRIYDWALSTKDIASFIKAEAQPLEARFTSEIVNNKAPTSIKFSSEMSDNVLAHLWDFGDGYTGFGASIDHQYEYGGTYMVRLTMIDYAHREVTTTKQISLDGARNPLQMTPVFINGEEGYGCYRIPVIVRAANGDLVAFAEARLETCSDATDNIHAVCKRSTDNGQTWEPLQIVARNPLRGKISVVQNISPVVDTVHGTGRIIVLYNKAEYSEWDITAGTGVIQTYCIFSDDNGVTWHSETDITMQVHRPYVPEYVDVYPDAALPENQHHDWRMHRPTLGHGIQLHNGRLFFVGSITQGNLSVFQSQNIAMWSDDLGESWHIGGILPRIGMNEAIAVELADGSVMMNTRAYHNEKPLGRRAITIGRFNDYGTMAFQETFVDETLIDSAVQASIIRVTPNEFSKYDGTSRIVFVNPAHPNARRNITVRLSYDEGDTWTVSKTIDPGPAAYSDLVIQHDGRIGLLYERGNQGGLWYASFTLNWLTDGNDSCD